MKVKGIDSKNMVRSDFSCGYIWSLFGRKGRFDTRQEWLILTTWEPSWVFHNWNQLPHELKLELCKIPLEKLEEMAKHPPQNENEIR
jgi:ABC-type proline/glycine betaine transport system substrate-binding protein